MQISAKDGGALHIFRLCCVRFLFGRQSSLFDVPLLLHFIFPLRSFLLPLLTFGAITSLLHFQFLFLALRTLHFYHCVIPGGVVFPFARQLGSVNLFPDL
uniref:Uncharacterized protein n=1 Tax=Trypanosoma congolense (strain IL3000) TaxID=1068625 RepID=G0URS2_TRYCI|nr:hypothetical protein, unlikely [Trypanosoma congolense IL3000]